jgi:dynein heavy chain
MFFSNTSKETATSIIILKLWYHECRRTFADRMGKPSEEIFNKMVLECLKEHTGITWKQENLLENTVLFGDFLKLGGYAHIRPYQEIEDFNSLPGLFDVYLKSYAMQANTPTKLVFFKDAVEHTSRIARSIRMHHGHTLLLGMLLSLLH